MLERLMQFHSVPESVQFVTDVSGAVCNVVTIQDLSKPVLKLSSEETQKLEADLELKEHLFKILRTRSNHDVTTIIRRLRAGHSVERIVRDVRDGDLLLQTSLNPMAPFRYDFPFLSAMPEVLYISGNCYLDSLLHRHTDMRLEIPVPGDASASDHQAVCSVPYHATELVEPRLDHVKASRWTNVTSSDEIVRRLLSTYFQYEFPYNCFFP